MISSRDNLLLRPWEDRKYQNHKKKVKAATPAIDTKAPPYRPHVELKLKKQQKEIERSQKIERENLILLQRLKHIMATHWLDNYLPPQPNFLSRVAMFRPVDSGIGLTDEEGDHRPSEDLEKDLQQQEGMRCRKLKCLACSPLRLLESVQVPEERVPWEPQKKPVGRRSRSVPPKREKSAGAGKPIDDLPPVRAKTAAGALMRTNKESKKEAFAPPKYPNSISFSRGSLRLSVTFPADTLVKFDRKRMGQQRKCRCPLGKSPLPVA